jgi:hypothetical protein
MRPSNLGLLDIAPCNSCDLFREEKMQKTQHHIILLFDYLIM